MFSRGQYVTLTQNHYDGERIEEDNFGIRGGWSRVFLGGRNGGSLRLERNSQWDRRD